MKEHVKEWIDKAEEDLFTCNLFIQQEYFPPAQACFHAQQCAEKYLKAFIIHINGDIDKTHDLVKLLDSNIIPSDKDFSEIRKDAQDITDYGVFTRYPGASGNIDIEDAKEAIEKAIIIKEFILSKIK